ncbi:hypothetical protein [Anabaena azotica]|uniref:Uncharacterized protein n=1 Tax=Anabaena azotica FACHB-119 TaxID=947527 RepID=A0ABR8CZ73_9NOST|nr:hypothetical protein [Anabaena azotica]MBD2499266.1 hypothetical protein [Anabaena azotica FACHB-119]
MNADVGAANAWQRYRVRASVLAEYPQGTQMNLYSIRLQSAILYQFKIQNSK